MLNRHRAVAQSRLRTPRYIAAAVVSLALVATAVAVTASAPPRPQAPHAITEAPDTGQAIAAARRQGTEVEAVSMRTSTREVFALPDGKLQARLSAAPQRVQKNGKWEKIDPALAEDGARVAPKATDAGISFSGGGESEPLVRLVKDGNSFALSWPGKLPAPRLDGATATYDEVLPGVDLRMTAANDGYQLVLVVKSREAAASVATVKLGLKTEGLTVQSGVDGAFNLVDSQGKAVFEVPRSVMWDSKKQPDSEAPRTDYAAVGVQHSAGALTLVPDRQMLNDPATVYPVLIDPDGRVVNHGGAWTTVYDNGSDAMRNGTHWNGANSQAEDKWWVVVNPTARSGRAPETTPKLITRSYFQFDTSFLAGTTIFGARMDATVVHASTACGVKRWHDLHVAGWDIGSGTNWNNQPPDHGVLAPYEVPSLTVNLCQRTGDRFTSVTDNCEGQTKLRVLGYTRAYAPMARYYLPTLPWDHHSTTHGVQPGYKNEGNLGALALTNEPGTIPLYTCQDGTDFFTTKDSTCGGKKLVTSIGYSWTSPPPGVESKPLNRCKVTSHPVGNYFESSSADCEGNQVIESLGHIRSYLPTTAPTF